jgi:large subunit ribosomal protein L18
MKQGLKVMKDLNIKKNLRRERVKKHIRKHVHGNSQRPRLVVSRGIRSISAQVVDDDSHRTLFTVTSLSKEMKERAKNAKGKVAVADLVGQAVAEEAKKHNIEQVVFDRNAYLYHGRVKAVADGARKAGLKF